MSESDWISFWKAVLAIGLGSYFLLVLVVIPFGFRDVVRMFRSLDTRDAMEDKKREQA